MHENESYVVKEYKFGDPLNTDTDFIINRCFKDCNKKFFDNFNFEYIYDIKLSKITDIEINNLIISGRSMNLYDLNKNQKLLDKRDFNLIK